jgi:hypothetical protein
MTTGATETEHDRQLDRDQTIDIHTMGSNPPNQSGLSGVILLFKSGHIYESSYHIKQSLDL